MKKLSLLLISTFLLTAANACEICGCGLGNYYIGIMPHFKSKFIGLRYQFHKFNTRLTEDPTQFSRDFYQTIEVWSGFSLGKKTQVMVFVPYNINHQVSDEGTTNLNGLGDVALLLNYKIMEKHNSKSNQELWIGGGLKLPTGKFELETGNMDLAAMANTQRGSGSTDFMLNTMYNLKSGNWGINANASYKINTANKDEYQFGNKLSAGCFVYHASTAGKTTISPNLGLLFENNGSSEVANAKIDLTGGSLLQGAAGLEIGFQKMALGFNVQLPLAQNFAEKQTESKVKGMLNVSFAL